MNILVTGGAGFIGSNFVHMLVDSHEDYKITVLDKLTYAGNIRNLDDVLDKIVFISGDICDKIHGTYDVIFNFAAETHVDRSIENPYGFIRSNIDGTFNLLEYARRHDINRFVQISTDEVYGSLEVGSASETSVLNPSSPYSASKAAADHLVMSYFKTYDLPILITRSSNNFGPYQHPEKLIPMSILKLLLHSKIPIYGSGNNVRDWIFVSDNCSGIHTVFKYGVPGEIYNIGADNELSNLEVIEHLLGHMHGVLEEDVEFVADRSGHDFRYSINTAKIKKLGWKPIADFDKSISDTIDWYLSRFPIGRCGIC